MFNRIKRFFPSLLTDEEFIDEFVRRFLQGTRVHPRKRAKAFHKVMEFQMYRRDLAPQMMKVLADETKAIMEERTKEQLDALSLSEDLLNRFELNKKLDKQMQERVDKLSKIEE